jgi:hypothetical protein
MRVESCAVGALSARLLAAASKSDIRPECLRRI